MSALDRSIRAFKENLAELLNASNTYQINQDIYTEIKGVLSALDSIKIDNLFLSTAAANSSSPASSWALNRSKTELSTSSKYKADPQMTQAILAQGEVMLNELKIQLSRTNMASLRENEIRKINTNAKERLRTFIRNLHPFAYGSYVRVDNQVTELGVNDRYKMIRNELAKPKSDPLDYYSSWNDKTLPGVADFKTPDWRNYTFGLRHDDPKRSDNKASCTNRYQAGSYFNKDETSMSLINASKGLNGMYESSSIPASSAYTQYQQHHDTLRACDNTGHSSSTKQYSNSTEAEEPWKKHAREAGINLEFPGISEQKSKYKVPEKENYKNFVINPQPDLAKFKRPFTMPIIEKKQTEYQFRYKFPDSKEIDKFPWIKQF